MKNHNDSLLPNLSEYSQNFGDGHVNGMWCEDNYSFFMGYFLKNSLGTKLSEKKALPNKIYKGFRDIARSFLGGWTDVLRIPKGL